MTVFRWAPLLPGLLLAGLLLTAPALAQQPAPQRDTVLVSGGGGDDTEREERDRGDDPDHLDQDRDRPGSSAPPLDDRREPARERNDETHPIPGVAPERSREPVSEPDRSLERDDSPEPVPTPDPTPLPEHDPAPTPAPAPTPEPAPALAPQPPYAAPPESTQPQRPLVDRSGTLLGRPVPPPPPRGSRPSPQPQDAADYEPGELLLLSENMDAAGAAARSLNRYGLRIKSRESLANLGLVLSVFRLPDGADVLALQQRIHSDMPDLELAVNQRYRPLSDDRRHYGRQLINWIQPPPRCTRPLRIGLLDTAVDSRHPVLEGQALVYRGFAPGDSPAEHGTAVASLLVGRSLGLLPEARVWAAGVFRRRGRQVDTSTDLLLRALDWLLEQRVEAINMSLGGSANRVLELALQRTLDGGTLLVAAVGNSGPDQPPAFPAAYPGVFAITAVDAARRPYGNAHRGPEVDFAAPGVDIWAAGADAASRYYTGTSFAVPFATAVLALERANGGDWLQRVQRRALDLGPEGRDESFGWGLIQWPERCGN